MLKGLRNIPGLCNVKGGEEPKTRVNLRFFYFRNSTPIFHSHLFSDVLPPPLSSPSLPFFSLPYSIVPFLHDICSLISPPPHPHPLSPSPPLPHRHPIPNFYPHLFTQCHDYWCVHSSYLFSTPAVSIHNLISSLYI